MTNQIPSSQNPSDPAASQLVYALGTVGYDFGSEACRNTFKQLMPPFDLGGGMVSANPDDVQQMVDYLASDISKAQSLIWTLNIGTPIYALEPKGSYAQRVYRGLQEFLSGQIRPEDDDDEFVSRVTIPGVLSGRTVKLLSGQVVPVVELQSPVGMRSWRVEQEPLRRTFGSVLNRVYDDLRNLGTTSQDRALNYALTDAFQEASIFSEVLGVSEISILRGVIDSGMELNSVTVEKSPFSRMDNDLWDVKLNFFHPEGSQTFSIFRFTIDVIDLIPVRLGDVKNWTV